MTTLKQKSMAEIAGTFALVFCGTGAVIINDLSGGRITHAGIAMTFGLIVLAMIYAFGDVSGAHFNPAVTLGFWLAGRFPAKEIPVFLFAQLTGACLASLTLRLLFPEHSHLGITVPAGPVFQSFVLEIILTFLLMVVILQVSTGAKEKGIVAGLAVGSVVWLEAMFAGPVTGASMNPARSLAPALLSGHLDHVWIYLAAPLTGAALAIPVYKAVQADPTSSNHDQTNR